MYQTLVSRRQRGDEMAGRMTDQTAIVEATRVAADKIAADLKAELAAAPKAPSFSVNEDGGLIGNGGLVQKPAKASRI